MNLNFKGKQKSAGFTLIEIMIVIIIIGLISAMLLPTLFGKLEQAQEVRVAQDIRAIESALKFYRLDNYQYPTQAQGLDALFNAPLNASRWNGPYLETVPQDPWESSYQYVFPSTHGKDVDVFTLGADKQVGGEGADTDWGNWNIQ